MRFENSHRLLRVGGKGPVAMIEGAAENDSVAAGEHIAAAEITVINLGLRQQHFKLSAHRFKLLITKECSGTQAGAVEYDWLRQAPELFTTAKFLDHQSAAGDIEVAQQSVKIHRRLDEHRVVLPHKVEAEVMIRI